MSPWRKIMIFTILRLAFLLVPFVVLMLLGIPWWASALIATVIGLCLSYLFLHRQRSDVSEAIEEIRLSPKKDADNDLENEVLDREESEAKKR